MSEQKPDTETEDVLSSIRRLVADNDQVAGGQVAPPFDPLMLTPALRVVPPPLPPAAQVPPPLPPLMLGPAERLPALHPLAGDDAVLSGSGDGWQPDLAAFPEPLYAEPLYDEAGTDLPPLGQDAPPYAEPPAETHAGDALPEPADSAGEDDVWAAFLARQAAARLAAAPLPDTAAPAEGFAAAKETLPENWQDPDHAADAPFADPPQPWPAESAGQEPEPDFLADDGADTAGAWQGQEGPPETDGFAAPSPDGAESPAFGSPPNDPLTDDPAQGYPAAAEGFAATAEPLWPDAVPDLRDGALPADTPADEPADFPAPLTAEPLAGPAPAAAGSAIPLPAAALAALAAPELADGIPPPAESGSAQAEAEDDMIRDLVRDVLREELEGALGVRITQNVRKLVRAEIARALAAHDLG